MSTADPCLDYYHINRIVDWSPFSKLNPGDQIDIGGMSNPYFRFFETRKITYPVMLSDDTQLMVSGVRFLALVASGELPPPNNFPNIAHDLANHFTMYVRELIWEDVRKKEFPHLPSRQRCIWLIPSLTGVKYWIQRMGVSGEFQVLRVRAQGRIHKANELFLLGDSEPMEETIRNARQYWLGIGEDPNTEEIIFEGRVTVVDVMSETSYA
jgi:hypothetical protein